MITAVILALAAVAIFRLSRGKGQIERGKGQLERAAQWAHIVEGLAVLGALSFAGFEYGLHWDADAARKREAATTILARSFEPRYVDEALGMLYRKYNQNHKASKEEDQFDDDTGSLESYFWSIDTCVRTNLCSLQAVLDIFCYNYKNYVQTYARVHGKEKTKEQFGDLNSLNNCLVRKS
jgi:hypothetical protein